MTEEIETSRKLYGYKLMHLKCIQNGFVVSQDTVRILLQIIDSEGVKKRSRRRLVRRAYLNPGPNFVWHVDSYDKLKPYGICINGAIDGYSRFVLWLKAYITNSDPKVVGNYFVETVRALNGCPVRVRADLGTENGHIENIQKFFRFDHTDCFSRHCFIYGSSNHNQRIESWWSYLRQHNVQYWINKFQELKDADLFTGDYLDKSLVQFCFLNIIQIDLDLIKSINDPSLECLANILPVLGDRIALRQFCIKKERGSDGKRNNLLEKLRKKMALKSGNLSKMENLNSGDEESDPVPLMRARRMGNRNSEKPDRFIEMAWIHDGKQIRGLGKGGGTRKFRMLKDATKEDLMEKGRELFFPRGQSKLVSDEDVEMEIVDFNDVPLPEGETVCQIYGRLQVPLVRVYLQTVSKDKAQNAETSEHQRSPNSHCELDLTLDGHSSPLALQSVSTQIEQQIEATEARTCKEQEQHLTSDMGSLPSLGEDRNCEDGPQGQHLISDMGALPSLDSGRYDISSDAEITFHTQDIDNFIADETLPISECLDISPSSTEAIPTTSLLLPSLHVYQNIVQSSESDLNSTIDAGRSSDSFVLRLRRTHIIIDMINAFKNPDILNCQLKVEFVSEVGADERGISRDAYCSFWHQLFCMQSEGERERIPALNPNYGSEEWMAVGRILLKGWDEQQFFPLTLSKAFFAALTHGFESVYPSILFDSYMNYLSLAERDVVQRTLGGTADDADEEELMDIISESGSHVLPKADELKHLITQIAFEVLIQKPKFALDMMALVCKETFQRSFPDFESISKLYDSLQPTARKVVNLFKASPNTKSENDAFTFLVKFTRSLSDEHLKRFLRFLTGYDVISSAPITVTFTKLVGLGRRLIAHTCGRLLELPSTYKSYAEFRGEAQNQLSGDCMTFDFA